METQINAPQEGQGETVAEDKLDAEMVRSKMNIPPELEKPYQKMILAGMKIMFSPETRGLLIKSFVDDPETTSKKLAQGITGIMGIIWKESKGTVPPQLIIPVAIELLMHAVDFVQRSEISEVTKEEIGDAMEQTIEGLKKMFGVEDEAQPQEGQPNQQTSGGLLGGAA